ncbi:MAG: hypothetical protein CMK99_05410 [Pseudomonas sp.]|jgi:hypothetical protein|nr:hypothetical protein [Pseudomonas sp.]|tara:strand:- start:996 stop:1310 length:315 start_codon:yes stop_codon:yes gene_type:complete
MHFLYLANLLIIAVGPLVKMVLKILGIGIASYVGFNFIIGEAHDHLISYMSGSSIPIQQILGLAKLDVVLNIYFAAITTKMFIAGMNKAGEVKRFKFLTGDGLG